MLTIQQKDTLTRALRKYNEPGFGYPFITALNSITNHHGAALDICMEFYKSERIGALSVSQYEDVHGKDALTRAALDLIAE